MLATQRRRRCGRRLDCVAGDARTRRTHVQPGCCEG
jgi:hypothetical protein